MNNFPCTLNVHVSYICSVMPLEVVLDGVKAAHPAVSDADSPSFKHTMRPILDSLNHLNMTTLTFNHTSGGVMWVCIRICSI